MIGIATAVWKRKEVFHIWAKNVKHCFPGSIVSVAYSEDDYKSIIESYGFIAVRKDNKPIGWKFNAAIYALKGKCDNIIVTGSDDITSNPLAQFYRENVGIDYVAFLDCFFYDIKTKKTKLWSGYTSPRRMGEPIGAGKMLSAKLMDALHWQPFPAINKSLDWHFNQACLNVENVSIRFSYLAELKDCYIVDIKNEISMNKFDNLPAKVISNAWQKVTHYENV